MNQKNEHLEHLSQIRSLMERSSRFISLSGLSGIFAGIFALIGGGLGYHKLYNNSSENSNPYSNIDYYENGFEMALKKYESLSQFLVIDAVIIVTLSFAFAYYFTSRKALKQGFKVWDSTARRLLINLLLPLAAGGIFCLALIYHKQFSLLPAGMLLFYGLALLNAGKYTLGEIRFLGITEMGLGIIASFLVQYSVILWMVGFGIMHIGYGTAMYFKYEK